MKIIGGHDYYDIGLSFGQDDDIVFIREKDKRLSIKEANFCKNYNFDNTFIQVNNKLDIEIKNYRINDIFFCGKRYCGITLQILDKFGFKDLTFWNYQSINEYCKSINYKIKFSRSKKYSQWHYNDDLEEFFNQSTSKDELNFIINNKITILTKIDMFFAPAQINGETYWRVDGDNLKDFEFYRVIDPFTAYQEISMWIGGILPRNGNDIVEITNNKVLLTKHGFDDWSFKKMKEK